MNKTGIILKVGFFVCFFLSGYVLFCQRNADTTKFLKNTIRFNITNPLLFGDEYNVIGYERLITRHQTFAMNIGRFGLPGFRNVQTDSLSLNRHYSDKGFALALEYRFYLRKENKYQAPRGVYIGPYYAFNFFDRKNTWSLNTNSLNGDITTDLRLNLNLIGFQMGYQFVIKKRLALDLILVGPGIWSYSIKTKISTTLSPEDELLVFGKINEILSAKLPGHEILIKPGDFNTTGRLKASFPGYRYIIHIGFRF